jgi:WD40 repeat protein
MHPVDQVVAVAGEQQVLLYDTRRLELIGAIPAAGSVNHIAFSRDGKYLVGAGGIAAAKGFVQIWSADDGREVARVGEEVDAALTGDLDLVHGLVALGGPSRAVKIYNVADGSAVTKITKHTDWVTAVSYSPDCVLLATADRAGGLLVWEAATNAPYLSLAGHAAAVTSLSWSPDANTLASSSDDGKVRLWNMNDGGLI